MALDRVGAGSERERPSPIFRLARSSDLRGLQIFAVFRFLRTFAFARQAGRTPYCQSSLSPRSCLSPRACVLKASNIISHVCCKIMSAPVCCRPGYLVSRLDCGQIQTMHSMRPLAIIPKPRRSKPYEAKIRPVLQRSIRLHSRQCDEPLVIIQCQDLLLVVRSSCRQQQKCLNWAVTWIAVEA